MANEVKLTYYNSLGELYNTVPEFKGYMEYEDKEPGIHFAFFTGFIIEVLNKNQEETLERITGFLNRMSSTDDINIQGYLSTDIFIGLISEGELYINTIKKYLSAESLDLLDLTTKHWRRRL